MLATTTGGMNPNHMYNSPSSPPPGIGARGPPIHPPSRGPSPYPPQQASPSAPNQPSTLSSPVMQPGSLSASPAGIAPPPERRGGRRHYPTYTVDPSISSTPVPQPIGQAATGGYGGLVNGIANLNINKPLPPMREDLALVGQPPPIQDLNLPPPRPVIPQNIAVTQSPAAQCHPIFKRCTLNAVPNTPSLLKKSKLPLALLIEPYPSSTKNDNDELNVPVVTDTVVARCTRCKTYINPFVQFTQGALKWRCNMCGLENDVPTAFDWDVTNQQHADRWLRPELNYGCVDFVASAEYMVRPPQPPAYVFVIDTSFQAVQSGMIPVVAEAISNSLENIPNEDGRTKVAVITVDSAVGFYKLSGGEPEMLVVGDLSDIYLPRAPSDLLVDLADAKGLVKDLLERTKTMHNATHAATNCLGTALQAARKLLASTGGKIVCFQASLPSVGDGASRPKEESKAVTETTLMTPSSSFYRTFATECAKSQVCADMFVIGGGHFADVATLNIIPRFTGGQTHFYPSFGPHDQAKMKHEIQALLSERIGLEAVMRTRCSPGLICKAFHGNCTTRVPDIMALPNVPQDQSYCVELELEEEIQSPYVYFQTALLYTTCFGERRIRVINLCIPVARSLPEVFSAADQVAIARTICHQAIDKAVTSKLKDARELMVKHITNICTAYDREVIGSVASGASRLSLARNLALLPLLILSIFKTDTFNDANTIPMDFRAHSTVLLRTVPTSVWVDLVCPKFYCLHNMPQEAGIPDPQTGRCTLPPRLNLTSEKLERHGCYLIHDGDRIYIWIGKDAVPALCMDLIRVPNISQVQSCQVGNLPLLQNPFSQRVSSIIAQLRGDRRGSYYPSVYVVKEDGDPMLRALFLSRLVEDRMPHGPTAAGANQQQVSSGMSYFQWLGFIRAKCQ